MSTLPSRSSDRSTPIRQPAPARRSVRSGVTSALDRSARRAAAAGVAPEPRIVIAPPSWNGPVGWLSLALSLPYLLYRMQAEASGLGVLPYALALLAGGVLLLVTGRDRVEAGDDFVAVRRGARTVRRVPTRDFVDVQVRLLGSRLNFKGGQSITVPYFWTHAARLSSFFERQVSARVSKRRHSIS